MPKFLERINIYITLALAVTKCTTDHDKRTLLSNLRAWHWPNCQVQRQERKKSKKKKKTALPTLVLTGTHTASYCRTPRLEQDILSGRSWPSDADTHESRSRFTICMLLHAMHAVLCVPHPYVCAQCLVSFPDPNPPGGVWERD